MMNFHQRDRRSRRGVMKDALRAHRGYPGRDERRSQSASRVPRAWWKTLSERIEGTQGVMKDALRAHRGYPGRDEW